MMMQDARYIEIDNMLLGRSILGMYKELHRKTFDFVQEQYDINAYNIIAVLGIYPRFLL